MSLFSSESIVNPVITGASLTSATLDSAAVGVTPADGTDSTAVATTAFVHTKRATKLLSSVNLLALQTTAINIVAAPAAGFVLVPGKMFLDYKFNTTAYTIANADNAVRLQFTGKTTSVASALMTGLVDQSADTVGWASSVTPITAIASANAAHLGLELKLAIGTTPALTLGDGTVNVVLEYQIVPLI